jgi:hypothetical protein
MTLIAAELPCGATPRVGHAGVVLGAARTGDTRRRIHRSVGRRATHRAGHGSHAALDRTDAVGSHGGGALPAERAARTTRVARGLAARSRGVRRRGVGGRAARRARGSRLPGARARRSRRASAPTRRARGPRAACPGCRSRSGPRRPRARGPRAPPRVAGRHARAPACGRSTTRPDDRERQDRGEPCAATRSEARRRNRSDSVHGDPHERTLRASARERPIPFLPRELMQRAAPSAVSKHVPLRGARVAITRFSIEPLPFIAEPAPARTHNPRWL